MKKHFKSHKVIWVIKSDGIFLQGHSSISHQMTGMPHNVEDAVQWQLPVTFACVCICLFVSAGLRLKLKTVFNIKNALYQIPAPQMNSRGPSIKSQPQTRMHPEGGEAVFPAEGGRGRTSSDEFAISMSSTAEGAISCKSKLSRKKIHLLKHIRFLKVILRWKSQPNNYFYCSYITIDIINNLGTI